MEVELFRTVVMFRGIERLLIQCGALLCIGLGVLLFRWGVQGSTEVEGSVATVKFQLKNVAPGSVLAMFGMLVLLVGIWRPLQLSERGQNTVEKGSTSQPATQPEVEASSRSKAPARQPVPQGVTQVVYSVKGDNKRSLGGLLLAISPEVVNAKRRLNELVELSLSGFEQTLSKRILEEAWKAKTNQEAFEALKRLRRIAETLE